MFKFLKRKKKDESKRKFGCKRSPFNPDNLYWDTYGVYKKAYINKFDKKGGMNND
ncbi:hypothetical protein [Clostridium autoethanogenum]|uniref:hypothetical protein n=1 Tax=Clostridium autoethanogenum TaxID=84023 RepID=UPI0016051476|nr:hypothetical protein [Clostridium autoethanogenum]